METGQRVGDRLSGYYHGAVRSLAWDGEWIITGGDGDIRLWNGRSGSSVGDSLITLSRAKGFESISSVGVSRAGRFAAVGSTVGMVSVWDVVSREKIGGYFAAHSSRVSRVLIVGEGDYVVSGGDDGYVRVWDIKADKEIFQPISGPASVVDLEMSKAVVS